MVNVFKYSKESDDQFPEGKIVLLNGTQLQCYPLPVQPKTVNADNMALDTTGEYLGVGSIKKKPTTEERTKRKEEERRLMKFFTDHAFFFLEHAAEIFADSRMFLAPVPIQNALAYTGANGFYKPTLGVYLEWWMRNEASIANGIDNHSMLHYHLAGSPLSGNNSCSFVHYDGTTESRYANNFNSMWGSFMMINRRYNLAKQTYEAYTLQQVIDILKERNLSESSKLQTRCLFQEGQYHALMCRVENEKDHYNRLLSDYKALEDKYDQLCISLHQKELETVRNEYRRQKAIIDAEWEKVDEQCKELRRQMKQKLITPKTYQQSITALRRPIKKMDDELSRYEFERINYFTKLGYLSYNAMIKYIEQKEN